MEGGYRLSEPLIECVPNFSEGRDKATVEGLLNAVSKVSGVLILDRTSDWDHHRTVITLAGSPAALGEAAVRLAAQAAASIDLNRNRGVHPRVGALDVLPFVPLQGASMDDCVSLAHATGERISQELAVPVYFYGAAAKRPDRIALENIRRGQFEGLREAVTVDPTRAPDLGGPGLHPTAGAVIAGARRILIAYNINLKTTDLGVAKAIAREIRASSGGFPAVKALGLPLLSRNLVQVSMNLTDFEQTPPYVVYAAVARLAHSYGVPIEDSELVGLLPQRAVHSGKPPHFGPEKTIEHRIKAERFIKSEFPGPYLASERMC